jgi:hypothetical protein
MVVWRSTRPYLWLVGSLRKRVDYEESLAPVARYSSIRVVLSAAFEMGWSIHHMDVKTTFLNGVIEE